MTIQIELRPIPGFEGYYSITKNGEVYSHEREVNTKKGIKQIVHGKWLKSLQPRFKSIQYFLNKDGVIKVVNASKIAKEVFDPKHDFGKRPKVISVE